jgi:hypothetical protein
MVTCIKFSPAKSIGLSRTSAKTKGKNPNILNSGKQGSGFYQSMWKVLDEKGYWQGELWNRKKVVKYMQSYFLFHH